MKKLLGICIALLLVFGTLSFGDVGEDAKEELKPLINYAYSDKPLTDLEKDRYYLQPGTKNVMMSKMVGNENDVRWEAHRVKIGVYGAPYIEFSVRYYKDFTSTAAYGFEEWILIDWHLDGVVDEYIKEWRPVIRDYTGSPNMDMIIRPIYPEGFVNYEWYKATKEELQEKYEAELEFWLNHIKNK